MTGKLVLCPPFLRSFSEGGCLPGSCCKAITLKPESWPGYQVYVLQFSFFCLEHSARFCVLVNEADAGPESLWRGKAIRPGVNHVSLRPGLLALSRLGRPFAPTKADLALREVGSEVTMSSMARWKTIHFDGPDGEDPGKWAMSAMHRALAELEVLELHLHEKALDFRGVIFTPRWLRGREFNMARGCVELGQDGRSIRYRLSFKCQYVVSCVLLGLIWVPGIALSIAGRIESPVAAICVPPAICLPLMMGPILYTRMRFRRLLLRTIKDAGGTLQRRPGIDAGYGG